MLYRLKLLIVDDEPDTREVLKLVLVHSRAQVIAVATPGEGLEQLQAPQAACHYQRYWHAADGWL